MSEHSLDLVGIGECLVEMFEVSPGNFRSGFAGDVLNVLFYASRLELRTGILTALGTDLFTKDLIELLEHERIHIAPVPILTDRPNGLYAIRNGANGEPHFSFWRNDSAARNLFEHIAFNDILSAAHSSRYLHFSAIALAIIKDRERLEELVVRSAKSSVVSFDTNVRANLWPKISELAVWIKKLATKIKLLFVTDSDELAIYGERTPFEAIQFYHDLGFEEVVYRRGARGCIVSAGNESFTVPALSGVSVVDTTGAGDAFNAGYIFGHKAMMQLEDRAIFANAVAASAIGVRGGLNKAFSRSLAFENLARLRNQMAIDAR